jgi:hypothetical protein
MRPIFTLILMLAVGLITGQVDSIGANKNIRKKNFVFPSYRYINKSNHQMGVIFTNVRLGASNNFKTNIQYWVEPMYNFDKKIVGLGAVSKKWLSEGTIKAIEPMLSIKRFPFFKNESLNYVLDYTKYNASTKFYFENEFYKTKTLTIARIDIYEKFALFSSSTNYKIKVLNTQINRLEYVSSIVDGDNFGQRFYLKIDNARYKNPFDTYNKFTRLDINYTTFWKINKSKQFSLSFFIGYFIQNDNRDKRSFSNDIVKGSIALSQQGFNDYAYDKNFVSRKSSAGMWDNQISTSSGGGFKYASSINSSLGMTNDFAYAINTSVNLPGSDNWLKTAAYFDIGAYKVDKMNYLYSAGISFDFNEIMQLYVPLINSSAISQNYRNNNLTIFEKINYQIKLVHHFTNRT